MAADRALKLDYHHKIFLWILEIFIDIFDSVYYNRIIELQKLYEEI